MPSNVQSVQDTEFPRRIRHSIQALKYKDLLNQLSVKPKSHRHEKTNAKLQVSPKSASANLNLFAAFPTFLYTSSASESDRG